ncbi:hypothetical protein DL96DRAFT_930490 [Flagelloscypha sp. PMI_526]|nr:hypothetical protein DL96DRAFT_930490 [Flagelloscypha sp. PMI_526]
MDAESYLLLLLADSNLPTGSFVASAGLESYIKHGFASVTSFVQESLASYAKSSLPFVSDTRLAIGASSIGEFIDDKDIQTRVDDVLKDIRALDELYETMTLNHVARRASKTQGVALLTLYSRSFAPPEPTTEQKVYTRLLDRFKLLVRRGDTFGHLPICWGLLAGALGLHIGIFSPRTYKPLETENNMV